MLKVKSKASSIIMQFGSGFRPIQEVQAAFLSHPMADETLVAILWECKDRGVKGHDQTEQIAENVEKILPQWLAWQQNKQ